MILRVERRRGSLITEDNVRVDIGIQVRNAVLRDSVDKGSLALTRGVIAAVAARVVGSVAVNVQVVILTITLEEDGVGQITTVDGAAAEGIRESAVTATVLS